MKDRLEQFLTAEGITRANFADSIGVARAAITHIMSGRNNPGYDFIINTMKAYPALNIEWLLNGSGAMYKTEQTSSSSIFSPSESFNLFSSAEKHTEAPQNKSVQSEASEVPKVTHQLKVSHQVNKVIIFYDDGTFEELSKDFRG